MRAQPFGYALALAALVSGAACGRTNNAVKENRPDAAAVNRANTVTNTTDNKEGATDNRNVAAPGTSREQHEATATTGAIEQDADGRLASEVRSKFTGDDVMKNRQIDVDARGGVVTLQGSVASKLEHDRAEQLARSADGVKQVVNKLMIDANVEQHQTNSNHGGNNR